MDKTLIYIMTGAFVIVFMSSVTGLIRRFPLVALTVATLILSWSLGFIIWDIING